jgi:hypothetical protein
MARFILDIANLDSEKINMVMETICELSSGEIFTIHCIDETNDNQFYDDSTKNILSKKQIANHKEQLKNK